MRRLPGTPGMDRSDRSRRHWTVTETVALSPTVRLNWLESMVTSMSRQWMPWLERLVVAAEIACVLADALVRSRDAERAASAAAVSTDWCVVAVRPPKMMSPTKSRNAGTPMTASMAAD